MKARSQSPTTEQIPPPISLPPLQLRRPSLPITSLAREMPSQIRPMTADQLVDLLQKTPGATVVDIRPYCDYTQSRVQGALHFCIPSTFLKRASYSFRRTVDNMLPEQRHAFDNLAGLPPLVVYDRSSEHLQTSQSNLYHTLMKFVTAEGWPTDQTAHYLVGGLDAWGRSEKVAALGLLDSEMYKCEGRPPEFGAIGFTRATASLADANAIPFPLVTSGLRQNPLFKSVRAAMEVQDDEYIEVQVPVGLKPLECHPDWVKSILSDPIGASKKMAAEFRSLEQAEKNRMFGALSIKSDSENYFDRRYSISGIELGVKNRYDNIYPYEHTRVKLAGDTRGCDYINASHISSEHSKRVYIATQAPLPETFADFFHMIWEERVPVIVQLAPEFEGAMLKCHNYWGEGTYGPYGVRVIATKTEDVDAKDNIVATIRTFEVSREGEVRQVTQIFYDAWPDLGRPANPADLLRLMELKDDILTKAKYPVDGTKVVVHCSAGCGRTGTFCAIDIVCNMMERDEPQYKNKDVVAEVVAELRTQRTSMVQSLRQYVLCYDSVLAWLAKRQ
ncbi:Phosphatidylinositol phosphatase PTPRQ [Yarrowia sp. C11]|nr:Phosphatidylinositol phosphatase PTPRQ [Yarrowia sp. C11]KAG5364055.1 Phosphatidylinositol phosphatase PTPRQ [Yarrowia sp. E02]